MTEGAATAARRPRRLVPEVVQTSAMDCGPAALKALLEGFHIPVSYGRLREACQTSVDGTSIDTLEDVAVALGLDAAQNMRPVDHVFAGEGKALPALVVLQQPGGLTHFVVMWSAAAGLVQVMDPATGRSFRRASDLARELYVHQHAVPAASWRDWAGTDTFLGPLKGHLRSVGVDGREADALARTALEGDDWRGLGALDAATRMVRSLVHAGALHRGKEATRAVRSLSASGANDPAAIPPEYWTVSRADDGDDGEAMVRIRGAVLLTVFGAEAVMDRGAAAEAPAGAEPAEGRPPLSPELAAALRERPESALRSLLTLLREDGALAPSAVALGGAVASFVTLVEALLFRGLLDASRRLAVADQRLVAALALVVLIGTVALLEYPILSVVLRLGRHLEGRLRVAYLEKLPRLGDRYFTSRLASDMAERGHMLLAARRLPEVAVQLLRGSIDLALVTAAVVWLDPRGASLAVLLAVVGFVVPFAFQPLLMERDLRMRTHGGALTRFYFDALRGLVPVRAHGAERALRREHEALLLDWFHAGLALQRGVVMTDAVIATVGVALSALLVASHLARAGTAGSALLLVYWALQLPVLGAQLATTVRQYPALRNVTLRILELLNAPEEELGTVIPEPPHPAGVPRPSSVAGVRIALEHVTVEAGGHVVLEDVSVALAPGQHVAVVGASGAGKSTLVGVLLGWHRPSRGVVRVDGAPLEGERLAALRSVCAWVDPAVHLWRKSLLDNIAYGTRGLSGADVPRLLDDADLHGVVERLPEGLVTPLGESGALVSGGEGQRVRFARAMAKTGVRLAILDEPFRGLTRPQRSELLRRARARFSEATLLFVSHDIGDTLDLDRVLVVEGGRVVEDGVPSALLAAAGSRYGALVAAEREVTRSVWRHDRWRHWVLEGGRLSVHERDPS